MRHIHRCCIGAAALCLIATTAAPQEQEAVDPGAVAIPPAADEPSTAQQTPTEGLSELDILSRSIDQEFPEFQEQAKSRRPVSVTLRALDKVTAKYVDLVIDIGATAPFGSLDVTPRYCDKRPPEEFPETTAFLQIGDRRQPIEPPPLLEGGGAVEPAAAIQANAVAPAAGAAPTAAAPIPYIFSGWMFASSPALNGLQHPVYDIWVIDCATVPADK